MKKAKPIPIEVLRVEDKIFASLNFTQAGLLAAPLATAALLLILPPSGRLPAYKLAAVALVFLVCGILAVRLHGRLVLGWLKLIVGYNLRPRRYVREVSAVKDKEAAVFMPPEPADVRRFVPPLPPKPPLVPIRQIDYQLKTTKTGKEEEVEP